MFGPRKIWQPCSLGESFLEENSNNEMVKCQLGFQNTIVTLSFFTKRDKSQIFSNKNTFTRLDPRTVFLVRPVAIFEAGPQKVVKTFSITKYSLINDAQVKMTMYSLKVCKCEMFFC
jgi:hypothetical protein